MITPEHLSPERVPSPRPAALPFGLTWTDLAGALPGAGAGGSAVVSHVRRGPHQGGHPSVIMTLSYRSPAGDPRRRTLFFKRTTHRSREALRHRFLAGHGVPVPDLAVCVERDDGEVLGLQFLPSIGLGPADVDEALRLVAALNRLTDLPGPVARTPPGIDQDAFDDLLGQALVALGTSWPGRQVTGWLETYRRAAVRHQELPTALTHGELAAQQVGRTEDGRLVVLDLATVGRRARFADIANLLTTLAQLSGRSETSVFGTYLGHLSQDGGPSRVDEGAEAELRLTRFVQGMEALPWRLGLGRPAELQDHLRTVAADHHAVLAHLAP